MASPHEWEDKAILASYGKGTWVPLASVLLIATGVSLFQLPWLCVLFVPLLLFTLWFFRDPERRPDSAEDVLIAPADGRVVEIATVEEAQHIHGPATKIAIFMSVFDVHVNRSPSAGVVEWVRHEPGRFMNAVRSAAGLENERTLIALRDGKQRPLLLNLVAGLIARRIVCPLAEGDRLARGQRLGMIKFGSRVEVFIPEGQGLHVTVCLGQTVRAGRTVLGEWR